MTNAPTLEEAARRVVEARRSAPDARVGPELFLAIEALKEALSSPVEGGWRTDLENAPKDGTPVDLWVHWPEHDQRCREAGATWDVESGEWRFGQFTANQFVHRPVVTHWQAPPAPPSMKGEGHGG